jgi:hypothetical protein
MNNADWQARLGANQYGAQGQLQQNMMPWSTMSNLWGGSIPNPVVSPGSGQNFMNNVGSPGIMGLLYGLSSK